MNQIPLINGIISSKLNKSISGKSGGWREYFDEEMMSEADRWIADNLRDSDLRFPSMEKK